MTHSVFENGGWKGFPVGHHLHSVSKLTLDLYDKTVEARHSLIYRPFMLANLWEDCTVIKMIENVPSHSEIKAAYTSLINSCVERFESEKEWRHDLLTRLVKGEENVLKPPLSLYHFVYDLFKPYFDIHKVRPTESLLLTYGRMLNEDDGFLRRLAGFRNRLIGTENLLKRIRIQEDTLAFQW